MCIRDRLVQIPEGSSLAQRFGDVCAGVIAPLDFAKHIDLVTHPGIDRSHTIQKQVPSNALTTEETVFLLIRNECSDAVSVTVKHDIDILLTLPLAGIRICVQVRKAAVSLHLD